MLSELSIKNFAIIDDLHIRFSPGLTIISGETGAGKSIIISAVNLILGSRANATLIRTGAETAELEALFAISPSSRAAAVMREHGYDAREGLIIRRTISRTERHRLYINGRFGTMQVLTAITQNLASISGQHAHQGLLKEDQQLLILDHFGGLVALRKEVAASYYNLIPLVRKLDELKSLQTRQQEHIELLAFQKREITAAAFQADEDIVLEKEKNRLKNAEALYRAIYHSLETLYNRQGAVVEQLREVQKGLENAAQIDPELNVHVGAIADASFHVEDIAENLRTYLKTVQVDEGRLEEIELRLDTLNRLKRKYGASHAKIAGHLQSIEKELAETENIADRVADTEEKIHQQHKELCRRASELSRKRTHTAAALAAQVEQALAGLKMARTQFKAALSSVPSTVSTTPYLTMDGKTISDSGIDQAVFLISPNVGEDVKPLAQIASGGELSRIVLALKTILAESESVESIVFDEVDAGIGGGTAEVIGKTLSKLARLNQVICITHLPQIAKFGDNHLKVNKGVLRGRTRTTLVTLDAKERVREIARMLGGQKITAATLAHAREMLAQKQDPA